MNRKINKRRQNTPKFLIRLVLTQIVEEITNVVNNKMKQKRLNRKKSNSIRKSLENGKTL